MSHGERVAFVAKQLELFVPPLALLLTKEANDAVDSVSNVIVDKWEAELLQPD